MGDKEVRRGAAASLRLRISAWTDPVEFMNGSKKQIDGNRVFVPDTNNLFKKTALKDAVMPGGGKRVLDDISLLTTIRDNNQAGLGIEWDNRVLQGLSTKDADAKKRAAETRRGFFNQVIRHCHDVLGVQCLIGFERKNLEKVVDEDGNLIRDEPVLAKWLKMATPSPSMKDVTDRIVSFCETNMPEYDGISFDLEGLGGSADQLEVAKRNIAAFYTEIASKIRATPFLPNPKGVDKGYDRLVAFAAGNLIGKVKEVNGPSDGKLKKSRLLKHGDNHELLRDGDDFVTATKPLKADFSDLAQGYELGSADRNLIIRPMSYDNFKLNDPAQPLDDWHADIVRYMQTFPTATFQLGVKTIKGDGQLVRGMDGVMGNAKESVETHVKRRCRDLLNPQRIGICFFPTSPSLWGPANAALNPTVPEAGRLPDHPRQCPLSAEILKVLNAKPK